MSTKETILYLIIFLVVLAIFLLTANFRRMKRKQESQQQDSSAQPVAEPTSAAEDSECCGQHEVCEKTTLLNTKIKPEYYDDEELDALSGRQADSYTSDELAKLHEVFDTLLEKDVAGWLRSLQLREIELPDDIKEQALMIVGELRIKANEKHQ